MPFVHTRTIVFRLQCRVMKTQMVRCAIASTVMFIMITYSSAQDSPRQRRARTIPEGVVVHEDLEYVPMGHARQHLDLYLPESNRSPLPIVLWIHGGGWSGDDKSSCPAIPFVAKGFAVAATNYRLSQHAIFPAQIHDCKAAIRWLRKHAQEYGLASERIGVWGQFSWRSISC